MFLVKFEACLNLMIRRAIAPLVLGFLIQSEQIAVADLTDDLEELEPKKSEEQSQPNTTSSSKQKSKKNTPKIRGKDQGVESSAEKAKESDTSQPRESAPKKSQEKTKGAIGEQPLQSDKKQPVVFEGDQLSGIKRLGTMELHKNVKVSQGDFKLEAENAKVFFDTQNDEVEKVIAKGTVKMSKVDPQTGELIRAYSQIAEFNAINQTVELIDKAKLIRGEDVIRGQIIVYDLKTGQLKASKVKGVVKPQENQDSTP